MPILWIFSCFLDILSLSLSVHEWKITRTRVTTVHFTKFHSEKNPENTTHATIVRIHRLFLSAYTPAVFVIKVEAASSKLIDHGDHIGGMKYFLGMKYIKHTPLSLSLSLFPSSSCFKTEQLQEFHYRRARYSFANLARDACHLLYVRDFAKKTEASWKTNAATRN